MRAKIKQRLWCNAGVWVVYGHCCYLWCHHGAGESTTGGSGRRWNPAGWTPAQLQSLRLFRRMAMQLSSSLSQLQRHLQPRSRLLMQGLQQIQ